MDQELTTLFSGDEAEESRTGAAISAGSVWATKHTKSRKSFSFAGVTEPCSTVCKPFSLDREGTPSSSPLTWSRQSLTPQAILIQWVARPCDEAAGSFGQPDDRVLEAKMGQHDV